MRYQKNDRGFLKHNRNNTVQMECEAHYVTSMTDLALNQDTPINMMDACSSSKTREEEEAVGCLRVGLVY